MQQNKKQAFTLVELIVVIVVITILGTIAFISLQGYSASARDSKRVNDIQKIKTSLELFSLDTGKYPLPNNQTEATYSGTTIWTQGTIGDGVRTNLSRNLTKKPLDPLTDLEYTYSTTQKQTEYEILGVYETTEVFGYTNILNQTQAENQSYPKVDGTYNQVAVKADKYIMPTPSIINAELPVDDEIQITPETINSQITTGGENLLNGTTSKTGALDITNFSVYEIPTSGVVDKEALGTIIQTTYSGTSLGTNGIYAELVTTTNVKELTTLVENTVLKTTTFTQTSTNSVPLVVTNGECGTANKTYSYSDSSYGEDTFCITGNTNPETPSFPTEGETITWDCEGINGGTTDNCSSTRTLTPINGVCGTANNVATLTAPSINLCSSGNPTPVTTNTSNFTWICEGLNEGTSASCSATRQFNVTFNANGGTLGTTSVVATYGLSMPTLATAPTRTGYTFNGYFSATSGGTKYYNADKSSATTYSITSSITLYAQWIFNPDILLSNGYYVINSDNSNFPNGCNTSGLPDYSTKCILKIVSSGIYVSPGITDITGKSHAFCDNCDMGPGSTNGEAATYCTNLKSTIPVPAGTNWYLPPLETNGLLDIYNNKSKIYFPNANKRYWSSGFYQYLPTYNVSKWYIFYMNDTTVNYWSNTGTSWYIRCIAK